MEDNYKVKQLEIMLNDLQSDEYALARLHSDHSKYINLDEGALNLLIAYYSGKVMASTRKFTKYPTNYVKASRTTKYPVVTASFHGADMATGRLDSGEFIQGIIKAMHQNDEFATAMADFFDPEINNEIWEDTTYEEIAIGIVDFCKDQYREWKSLQLRGREDNPFIIISDDESIVIS